jgi:hypothetical protein
MQTIIPLILVGLFAYLMFSRPISCFPVKGAWAVVAAIMGTIQKDPKINVRGTTPGNPWAV